MTKDEALRLALDALELVSIEFVCNGAHHAKKDRHEWLDPCPIVDRHKQAITAIKAALEAKVEPLAYLQPTASPDNACYNPLQRTWVGLTDEHKEGLIYMTDPNPEPHHLRELIDVVEFQLKEKNA